MRDWGALVHERMGRLGLTPAQQEEILAELAGHLEDLYEEGRARGLGESNAAEVVGRAVNQATDWRRLARKIHRAKREDENMNNRTKVFWLPALISVTGAIVFLAILTLVSLEPHMLVLRSKLPLMIYPIWVLAQPLFGAMAAYASRRGGGGRLARLGSSLFPSMVVLAFACGLPLAHTFMHAPGDVGSWDLVSFARTILFFVVVPGAVTLLGALPFLKAPKLHEL